MFLATMYAIQNQKDDALTINLAGRQRMLSQKMTKELYDFKLQSDKKGSLRREAEDKVRSTMEVFTLTLKALKNSGKVPLTLNLADTPYSEIPAAVEPTLGQLVKVESV